MVAGLTGYASSGPSTMYDCYIMRRTQIYIDESQGELLAAAARREGVTMSALIRRAIDAYLAENSSETERLKRFREAVEATAGIAPYLPSGADYVDEVRPDYSEREIELWGEPR